MSIISVKFIDIFTLDQEEFFGMSSDDVELFAFDKYDVSASKRTIVRVFPTISTPHLIANMSKLRIWDFWHISIFREGASNKPGVIWRRSIGFQIAQYSYFTDSKRSWPPIPTQHIYKSHTSPHQVPEKHILWVFSIAHSSSGWVLILSKILWLKNMGLQL